MSLCLRQIYIFEKLHFRVLQTIVVSSDTINYNVELGLVKKFNSFEICSDIWFKCQQTEEKTIIEAKRARKWLGFFLPLGLMWAMEYTWIGIRYNTNWWVIENYVTCRRDNFTSKMLIFLYIKKRAS